MKYVAPRWSKEHDGILYFFQLLEEMLFYYSSDIVRTPIHNSRTLILEYLQNEEELRKGQVKEYQVEQIINELRESIESNKILSAHFGQQFIDSIVKGLPSQRGDLIRYLHNKIPGKTYFSWTQQYLLEHCVQATHKDEIEFGLRSWIVEILSRGYSSEYIYKHLQATLQKRSPDAPQKLKAFIDHFSLEPKAHRIYFSFAPVLSDCKDLFKKRMDVSFDDDGSFEKARTHKNDFVGFVEISSYDRYAAVSRAFSNISTFLKYYRVMSNRKNELVRQFCIVQELETQSFYKLPVKPLGYRSIELEPQAQITTTIDLTILACQSKPRETNIQLNKTIDLHNQAIRQYDLNDGFVNLWSILEIICTDTVGGSKIEKVINGIVPILQKDYLAALSDNINCDLKDNLNKTDYEALITKVSAKNPELDPITQFVFLPEFEDLREEYFEKLQYFPNIRTKIFRLWKTRNDSSALLSLSQKYTQRIKWHIYRLYRTRNAIVHSGDTHRSIQMLGEHLHIYIDRVLNEILLKLSTETTLRTISDVLIDTKLSLQQIQLALSEATPISEEIIATMEKNCFYSSGT